MLHSADGQKKVNSSPTLIRFFDTTSMNFVTLKRIKVGEEFTFFYPSAEWSMDQSFQCNCGTANCIGKIKGAKYLSDASIKNYRFTDFIQEKLRTRDSDQLIVNGYQLIVSRDEDLPDD